MVRGVGGRQASGPSLRPDQRSVDDMLRFDRLGPLARDVVRHCPVEVDIGMFVSRFEQERRRALWKYDPSNWPAIPAISEPDGDRALAAYLVQSIVERYGKRALDVMELERERYGRQPTRRRH